MNHLKPQMQINKELELLKNLHKIHTQATPPPQPPPRSDYLAYFLIGLSGS